MQIEQARTLMELEHKRFTKLSELTHKEFCEPRISKDFAQVAEAIETVLNAVRIGETPC